jgi:hypothetical protein
VAELLAFQAYFASDQSDLLQKQNQLLLQQLQQQQKSDSILKGNSSKQTIPIHIVIDSMPKDSVRRP